MSIQMSKKVQHRINVGVRLAALGRLNVNGRSHPVTPLELSTEKLLFLCPWDIPVRPSVKLCYELDDSYDHFMVTGSSLSREDWKESSLYTARIQVSENEKLRITGMLNRMMCHHVCDAPIQYYTNTGSVSTTRRLMSTIIQ